MGRPAANTKLGTKKVSIVRARGGNLKFRALRLDTGNFSWGSEAITRKTRVLDVVYNSSNNELVRTKTLVKNAIIQIDATPFRQWYEQHYNSTISGAKKEKTASDKKEEGKDGKKEEAKKEDGKAADPAADAAKSDKKPSKHATRKYSQRNSGHLLDQNVKEQFAQGKLYACIASRPGQAGRCDGYILEGQELEFYLRKISKKK